MFPKIDPGTAAILGAIVTGTFGLIIQYFRGRTDKDRGHVEVLARENDSLHRTIKRQNSERQALEEKLSLWQERHKLCADEYHDVTGSPKHYHGFINLPDQKGAETEE